MAVADLGRRPPDLDNPEAGIRGWRFKVPEVLAEPGHAATLVTWLITGPFHPFWSWWYLGVTQLKDFPGLTAPVLAYPEAEFEFLIASMNPEKGEPNLMAMERGQDWGKPGVGSFLVPLDVVKQFHGVEPGQASAVGDVAAQAIVLKGCSPDSDWSNWWSGAIDKTVLHLQGRPH